MLKSKLFNRVPLSFTKGNGDVLKRLTESLPLIDLVVKEKDNFIEYFGGCTGLGLYKDDEVAVQIAKMDKGVSFLKHLHSEKEFLIVYRGSISVTLRDESYTLNIGDSIVINPNLDHCVVALSDAELVGVTVPAAEGYPNDKRK